jgi:hypothetical protein
MKDELATIIKTNRPKISDSSVKTYTSLLHTLYKKLDGDNGVDFFKTGRKKILEHIENIASNQSKKTLLSALYILTDEDEYREKMIKYANEVNNHYKTQKYDPERMKNLPALEELKEQYNIYKNNLKKNPSIENFIDYFIVAVSSTVLMAPRRALDWTEMKLRNVDKKTDNYIDGKFFVFNKFKTAKFKTDEEKRVPINDELKKMINKFMKVSDNEYLIYNHKTGNKLNSSQFTKKLNSVYGRKVGVDLIRSIYLSDLYKGLPKLQELEQVADQMGTSINSSLQYYVKR